MNLRIGVPSKGRLAEIAAELLKEAGLSFRRHDRSLFARCREVPIDVTFLRTEDIPVLCAEGAIDMGITGSDLVAESGASVLTRLELDVGQCRLAICVAEQGEFRNPKQLAGCRVATSFPRTTQAYLDRHEVSAASGESVRVGRDHDRVGRGRRDRRPGRDRQHAGGQPAEDSGRYRPLPDGADPERRSPRERAGRPRGAAAGGSRDRPRYSLLEYNVPRRSCRRPRRSRRVSIRRPSARWRTPPGARCA